MGDPAEFYYDETASDADNSDGEGVDYSGPEVSSVSFYYIRPITYVPRLKFTDVAADPIIVNGLRRRDAGDIQGQQYVVSVLLARYLHIVILTSFRSD